MKLTFHPSFVRWKYMSSGYCTKPGTEHCSIIHNVQHPKKIGQCLVDAPMLRSHRRQRPLSDNKEKPQPHSPVVITFRRWRYLINKKKIVLPFDGIVQKTHVHKRLI